MSDIEPPENESSKTPKAEDANPFVVASGNSGKTTGGETLRMVIIALAIVLFGLTLVVLFVLPALISSGPPAVVAQQEPAEHPVQVEPSTDETLVRNADDEHDLQNKPQPVVNLEDAADKLAARQTAQTLLAKADEKLQSLENKNASVWAPQKLKLARDNLAAGETAYSEQRYQTASNSYQKVISDLEDLEKQSANVLTESLAEGELALVAGSAADALKAFNRGLLIEPNNSAALSGKERAENLDEVLALVKEAQGFEELGETNEALTRYKAALKIDPQTSTATQAISKINSEAREKSFRAAMSSGFNALDKKDYRQAKKHFTNASSIKPGDSNAAEALTQANELIKTRKIDALLADANRKSQNEEWAATEKSLLEAKRLDNSIVGLDSRIGAARARQALEQQLLKYTSESSRLRSNAVHAEALSVLSNAKSVSSPGAKLNSQITRLEQTITAARTPRTVTLTSDTQTAVTVYKVGKFGSFAQKNLSLFPGSYVAVGKRTGFRDVRLEFSVNANNSAQVFDVRCEEQLQFGTR